MRHRRLIRRRGFGRVTGNTEVSKSGLLHTGERLANFRFADHTPLDAEILGCCLRT
jgi:hypothetical protein